MRQPSTSSYPDDDASIAQAWIAYTLSRDQPGEGNLDEWAMYRLAEIEYEDPVRALRIASMIAELSDDDWVLENLGAGPIESVLVACGAMIVDELERTVVANSMLRAAVSHVWTESLSLSVKERVEFLVGRRKPS